MQAPIVWSLQVGMKMRFNFRARVPVPGEQFRRERWRKAQRVLVAICLDLPFTNEAVIFLEVEVLSGRQKDRVPVQSVELHG